MEGYTIGLASNQLKDFSVKIDGTKLTNGQVNSIQMRWTLDSMNVVGSMVFRDMSDMVTRLPIRGDNKIVMSMTDFDGGVSKQEFIVVDVTQTRIQSGEPAVMLKFVDPISMEAIRMYNGMSWKKAKMSDIIDHQETLKSALSGKQTDFTSDLTEYENFVMHLGVSFNVIIHWMAKKDNVVVFQTRDNFCIKTYKDLFGGSKTGNKFIYKSPNSTYRSRIYAYETIFGKSLATNIFQPKGKVVSFDPKKKAPEEVTETNSGSQGKLSSTGNTAGSIKDTGEKLYYRSTTHNKSATEQMWSRNSHKDLQINILVPGKFETNVGDIVELDLVSYGMSMLPEINISGNWLITKVVDNIVPPDFVQRLTLSRAKYMM